MPSYRPVIVICSQDVIMLLHSSVLIGEDFTRLAVMSLACLQVMVLSSTQLQWRTAPL